MTTSRYKIVPAQRAFSLVEVLVVFGIIAILSVLLTPALKVALNSSKLAQCQSNLRNIGVGLNTYAADNNLVMPYGYWVPPVGESQTWDKLSGEYLGIRRDNVWLPASKLMQCPLDKLPALTVAGRYRRSYSMVRGSDGFGATANGVTTSLPGVMMARVQAPSTTILLAECSAAQAKGDSSDSVVGSTPYSVIDRPSQQLGSGNGKPNGLHNGRMSYLFADGHAETLAPSATIGTGTMDSPKGMWTISTGD